MGTELEPNWDEIPDKYLLVVADYLAGRINNTDHFDILKGPMLKSSIKSIYWVFLIQYAVLSAIGIIANLAIIAYIMYHKLYKDVTHAFLANLALCHFVQCSIVLPITLTVMILQNWIFGQFLCFFLPMLQDIPLHVAIFSHIFIAWDRMRWLGDPLKDRLPAFVCCCTTWLTGMIIAVPYPIYTIYVEIGDYVPRLSGMGLCVVNLMDDMHEYMRGLFVMMYCGPTVLLSYLYIRTSQELRTPDGTFAVAMFEHRADIRHRQRNSSESSAEQRSGRHTSASRSYDLYNAELDVAKEKKKQRSLGSMAATQILCVCPLMILRLARMVMEETYENTKHFDLTYLMFVWVAFFPTVIFPCIYFSEIVPRTEKDLLRGYFRLSSRKRKNGCGSREESIENEDTTATQTSTVAPSLTHKAYGSNSQIHGSQKSRDRENVRINVISNGQKVSSSSSSISRNKSTSREARESKMNGQRSSSLSSGQQLRKFTVDSSIDNSNSNITSSTYCNNGSSALGPDADNRSVVSSTLDFDKKWLNGLTPAGGPTSALKHKDVSFSDCGSSIRMGSSSTLARDMEIIDLLERERSMDIQDIIEREKRSVLPSRRSSTERRRLPDLDKICRSPKLKAADAYSYTDVEAAKPQTGDEDNFDDGVYPPEPAPSSTAAYYSRRLNRKSSHHSSSSRSKRDSFGSLNGDIIAGTFGELDPTQPLSKMSVIESRIRRSSGGRSSMSSSGRSSLRSRDYNAPPPHTHPELDFRENFADL